MQKKMSKRIRYVNSVEAYSCVCWCGCQCACGIFTVKDDKNNDNRKEALLGTSYATRDGN